MAVRLTELVTSGGCAAKYPAARLEELLAGFVPAEAEDLLVGLSPADDAAVYRLDDERALVFTLDFFPPLVDDPRDFGTIAATNALNDVFAMGGHAAARALDRRVPRGAAARDGRRRSSRAPTSRCARRARSSPAGTRSATREPKYGLAVVGTVHPDGVWPKAGAQPGDALFLTKPLGTGLVLHGAQRGLAGDEERRRGRVDATLNRDCGRRRCAASSRTPSPTSPASGCSATRTRWPSAAACALVLDAAAVAGARRRARGRRAPGSATGGDRAQPRVRRGARDGPTASPASWSRSATTRRPRAACSSRCPRERGAVLEAEFARARAVRRARIGRVEAGVGVARRLHGTALERVHVESTRLARLRALELSPTRVPAARVPSASLLLWLIVAHRRRRPADGLGARLRALARLPAGPAVPGEGLPLVHRVREPDGRVRDDRR